MNIRVYWILVLFTIWSSKISAETISELRLMHRRSPQNTVVLFHLAQTYLQINEYENALKYFYKLRDLNPSYRGLYIGMARSFHGLNQFYDAYEICILNLQDVSCRKFLQFFKKRHERRMDLFKFKFAINHKKLFDLEGAERLLRLMPDDAELIETIGEYFLQQNLSELAFDFLQLNPEVFNRRALLFRKMVREIRREFTLSVRENKEMEKVYFLAYYVWKFAPDLAQGIGSPSLGEVVEFFHSLVNSQSEKRFENFYRLAYLQSQADMREKAQQTKEFCDELSPNYLYSFILQRMMDRQFSKARVLQIR